MWTHLCDMYIVFVHVRVLNYVKMFSRMSSCVQICEHNFVFWTSILFMDEFSTMWSRFHVEGVVFKHVNTMLWYEHRDCSWTRSQLCENVLYVNLCSNMWTQLCDLNIVLVHGRVLNYANTFSCRSSCVQVCEHNFVISQHAINTTQDRRTLYDNDTRS